MATRIETRLNDERSRHHMPGSLEAQFQGMLAELERARDEKIEKANADALGKMRQVREEALQEARHVLVNSNVGFDDRIMIASV